MTSKTHPHAEATYQVIPFADGSFGVEVNIPENIRPRSANSRPSPRPRRGLPSVGGECRPKTGRAAGFRGPLAPEPTGTAGDEPRVNSPSNNRRAGAIAIRLD